MIIAIPLRVLLAGACAEPAVAIYMKYFDDLAATAARAIADGVSRDALVATATVPRQFTIAPPLVPLMTGFHRWNLQRALAELSSQ